jgi:integrase
MRVWSSTPVDDSSGRSLSQRTVKHIFSTLRTALNKAVKQRLIVANPCTETDAPYVERQELQSLDIPAATALLRAFDDSPIGAAIVTAIGSGLRRGELLALRWGDVDLVSGSLTVNRAIEHENGTTRYKDPKTARARC